MRKLILLVGIFIMLAAITTNAQVSIGNANKAPESYSLLELISNGTNGLRLPQITTTQRDAIDVSGKTLAEGLVIYNTTAGCIEYWNGTKWVSLCKGQANITFLPSDPTQPNFPSTGGDKGPFKPVDEPNCDSENPAYSFAVMVGSDFLEILVVNEATGEFRVSMSENPTATPRTAIVRITNNCSQEYKEFVFMQDGDNSTCANTATAPKILGENGTLLCENGATYLYLQGRPEGTYIWTLNGREVGRGTEYIATQSGKYIVYANKIGCTSFKPDTMSISYSTTIAPQPVSIIVGQNNGKVCGSTGTATLYAPIPADGTLVWYKDGQKQTSITQTVSGNYTTIQAGIGTWFTVVENSGCSSAKSNELSVTEDVTSGTALSLPAVMVNGSSASTITVCTGSTLLLEVSNAASYAPGTTFTWYINNDAKGTGAHYNMDASHITSDFVLQCRASGTGCSSASAIQVSLMLGRAPAATQINSGHATATICGSNPAILNAGASAGAGSYKWYIGGVEIGGSVNATHNATVTGIYTVRYKNASGCWSALSDAITVVSGGAISLQWGIQPLNDDAIENTSKTYSVITAPTPDSYVWTSSNPAVAKVTATGNGSSAIVEYLSENTSPVTISVSAANACGTVSMKSAPLTVHKGCLETTSATLSPSGSLTRSVTDEAVQFTATATNGSGPFQYEFFVDGKSVQAKSTLATYSYDVSSSGKHTVKAKVYGCESSEVETTETTVNVMPNFSNLTPGTGSLSGKTCFDVALTDYGNGSCGSLSSRSGQKVDFSLSTPFSQNYTFIPSGTGTVSNVRFYIVENNYEGQIVENSVNNGNYTFTVTFKNINELARGKDRTAALSMTVYCVFNNGTTDVKLSLNLNIMDCLCCPGYLAPGGEYATSKSPKDFDKLRNSTSFASLQSDWLFAKTGKDLCFYKTSGQTTTIVNGKPTITNTMIWTEANNGCAGTNTIFNDGTPGWRLPNAAELAAIQDVHNSLASQANSDTGTTNMLTSTFWSSTTNGGSSSSPWSFVSKNTSLVLMSNKIHVRCVKTY